MTRLERAYVLLQLAKLINDHGTSYPRLKREILSELAKLEEEEVDDGQVDEPVETEEKPKVRRA